MTEEQLSLMRALVRPAVRMAYEYELNMDAIFTALRMEAIHYGREVRGLDLKTMATSFFGYKTARQIHNHLNDFWGMFPTSEGPRNEDLCEDIKFLLYLEPGTCVRLYQRLEKRAERRFQKLIKCRDTEDVGELNEQTYDAMRREHTRSYWGGVTSAEALRGVLGKMAKQGHLVCEVEKANPRAVPSYRINPHYKAMKAKTQSRDYMFGYFREFADHVYEITKRRFEERDGALIRDLSFYAHEALLRRRDAPGYLNHHDQVGQLYQQLREGVKAIQDDSRQLYELTAGQDEDALAFEEGEAVRKVKLVIFWSVEDEEG